jgi:hypothetical protein
MWRRSWRWRVGTGKKKQTKVKPFYSSNAIRWEQKHLVFTIPV